MRSRIAIALTLALASCSGPSEEKKAPRKAAVPEKPPGVYKVRFDTTKGPFVVEVTRAMAPHGADHFFELVQARFYNGVRFHRVMRGFVCQFGINGDPKVNQVWALGAIPDDPVKQKNKKGTITYAKLGPNSRATQVFLNLRDNPELDTTGFAPFGKVVEGWDVVEKLAFLYGEVKPRGSGPDPMKIEAQGNAYLDREYPRLDAIKAASILGETPAP